MDNSTSGRRILVVDDNVDLAISTAMILRICGHTPVTAFNKREAIERARATSPEIILLDLGLPDGDGYEIARTLRHELGADAPRIIATTACDPSESTFLGIEFCFDEYLVKPVEMEQLLQALNSPLP